eukprot:Gb_31658 [translate_table: standard]
MGLAPWILLGDFSAMVYASRHRRRASFAVGVSGASGKSLGGKFYCFILFSQWAALVTLGRRLRSHRLEACWPTVRLVSSAQCISQGINGGLCPLRLATSGFHLAFAWRLGFMVGGFSTCQFSLFERATPANSMAGGS